MFITACNERGNSPPTVSKVRLYTKKSLLPKITRSYRGSSPSSSPLDPPLRWTTRLVVSYINKHKCINRLCKGTTPTWFSYHLIAVGYHSDAVISIGRLAIIHIQTSQGQLSCHLYLASGEWTTNFSDVTGALVESDTNSQLFARIVKGNTRHIFIYLPYVTVCGWFLS